MRLVLDTNVVMKALIKKSQTRAALLIPNHQFYIPEYAFEEIERHLMLIRRKTALSEEEIKLILSTLLTNIKVIPSETITPHMPEARRIMRGIDEDDAPFIASALSISCDGIWSDDEHLKQQRRVRIWKTRELIHLLSGSFSESRKTDWSGLRGILKSKKTGVELQHQARSKLG